jgi:hypothetical protein
LQLNECEQNRYKVKSVDGSDSALAVGHRQTLLFMWLVFNDMQQIPHNTLMDEKGKLKRLGDQGAPASLLK